MDIVAILQLVATAVTVAKAAIEAGHNAWPFIQAIGRLLSKDAAEITEAELQALQDQTDALSAILDAPLPPEEPDAPTAA